MIKIINEVNFDKWEEENNFGEEWIINIPKECIKGATLLLKEEYEEYENSISKIGRWWWLRSPGNCSGQACVVVRGGRGVYNHCDVSYSYSGIRPSLILNLQSYNLNLDIRDKFEFGEQSFTVLSNNLAICDDFIGAGCFREDYKVKDANIYEKSDVKKFVDDWFNKAYSEYEG